MSELMMQIENHYHDIVIAMDDPAIIKVALSLAYYTAMLDAAVNDPLDDPIEHAELVVRYNQLIQNKTEEFQALVNDML